MTCELKRVLFVIFLITLAIGVLFGDPPPGYYASAEGLSGAALKNALHNIIKNHTVISYTATEAALKVIDEDPLNSNNVLLHYKGISVPKSGFGTTWNREHLWPQSLGADVSPKKSDLHHLFAEDVSLNSSRGNSVFDNVYPNHTGSAYGNYWTSTKFEPRTAQKGDVARALFYMDVRYDGTGGEADLALINSTSPNYGQMGVLSTLLQWHMQDPPDDAERARNDKIYQLYQHNRNPFIDRPEFANLIWAPVSHSDTASVAFANLATSSVSAGAVNYPFLAVTLTASANEWDLASLTVRNTGSLPDSAITHIRLYRDADNSGTVTNGDPLLATQTLSGGVATLSCSSPSRVTPSSATFLIVATISSSATNGNTVQLRVEPNSILHSSSGGNDIDPTFTAFSSVAATVTGGVNNGDSLNVALTSLAPSTVSPGQANVPFLRIRCNANSSEWDLASVNVTKVGSLPDGRIVSIELYYDANTDGAVGTGDVLLASTPVAGGTAILNLTTPYRITAASRDFLVVATFGGVLANGDTVALGLSTNGLTPSPSGGADITPTLAAFTSNSATVTGGVSHGDTISVLATGVAPSTARAGAVDIPLLAISLTASSNEWDVDTISFSKTGTCPDASLSQLKLYYDADQSMSLSPGDTLIASTTISGGSFYFGLGSWRITTTSSYFLVTSDLAPSAPNGTQFVVNLQANAVVHSSSGGDDIDPTYTGVASGTVTVQNPNAGSVKIVMVSTRGSDGTAAKEFISLANHGATPVSLSGWQLRSRGGGATADTVLNLSGSIPAYGHFLIASQAYGSVCEGKPADFVDSNTSGLFGGMGDSTGRSIGLFNSSSQRVDGFSFLGGATTPNNLHEGSAFGGAAGSSTVSFHRKRPGGASGPYTDTDNNATDLENITSKTPLNSSDQTIGPISQIENWSLYELER